MVVGSVVVSLLKASLVVKGGAFSSSRGRRGNGRRSGDLGREREGIERTDGGGGGRRKVIIRVSAGANTVNAAEADAADGDVVVVVAAVAADAGNCGSFVGGGGGGVGGDVRSHAPLGR